MNLVLEQFEGMPEARFDAGGVVIGEGERLGKLFALVEGEVEIVKQEVQINTVSSPGAVFGEMSVLLNRPHMATVRALAPSRFLVAEDALGFLKVHPEINLHLATLLARRLSSVTLYLVDLKQQFEERKDHLGMVDEVLESLLHHQGESD